MYFSVVVVWFTKVFAKIMLIFLSSTPVSSTLFTVEFEQCNLTFKASQQQLLLCLGMYR